MAIDVLAYNAFNQQVQLNQQIAAKTTCLATKCSETAAQLAIAANFTPAALCWVQCTEPTLLRQPAQNCTLWTQIPDLTGATQGFKVCRGNGGCFFNYGATCSWTVPAGVTRARFQIWGAGGGSGGGCCCGGSVWGSSGAYASVIIPVTAGTTYTLCAGCAAQTIGCGGNNPGGLRIPGCPSFVTGAGLCNFCAEGGQGRMGNWMAAYGNLRSCRIHCIGFNYCGPYMCNNGNDYCYTSSCACTGGVIPYVPGASYFGTTTSTSPSIVYGIRGSWSRLSLNNYSICNWHPPVYCLSPECLVQVGSSCAGCLRRACCGIMAVPSAGGAPTFVFAGCTTAINDYGRGGMVCVTFC